MQNKNRNIPELGRHPLIRGLFDSRIFSMFADIAERTIAAFCDRVGVGCFKLFDCRCIELLLHQDN